MLTVGLKSTNGMGTWIYYLTGLPVCGCLIELPAFHNMNGHAVMVRKSRSDGSI